MISYGDLIYKKGGYHATTHSRIIRSTALYIDLCRNIQRLGRHHLHACPWRYGSRHGGTLSGVFEILSYSQGFTNPGGSSTPQCSDTSIQKNIDVTSQFFARSVLDQSTTPFTATLYFVNSSAVADTVISMSGVTVTSVSHGASEGGGTISEAISMHATSLTVKFNNGTVKKSYTTSCP